jgi:hypothetical protein
MLVPTSRRLGRFEIAQRLGRGGMADVYLAKETVGGYSVALKLIEHAADGDTRDAIEAERRGAWLQARLADIDPHVARVYDVGDVEGFFFVAMEYVAGEDLAEIVRRGPLDPARACEVALAVCETLERAHTLEVTTEGREFRGIVHGDIKPKNIRIEPGGSVRVLDFGIAKALSLSRKLTRNEFGSVPYASPERLESGEVNVHSDLWSLAVMLYELIAGVQPYRAAGTEQLEKAIGRREPPPPLAEACPEPLRRILEKALAPEESMRYASGAEFAADLAAFRDGRPVLAGASEDSDATRRTFRPQAAADDDDVTRRTLRPAPPSATGTVRPAAPRRRWSGRVGRAIAVVLLAVMTWLGYQGVSTFLMWRHGRALDQKISTERITDPDEIWKEWTELSGDRSSSVWLWGARGAVRQRLVAAADHVIDSYRLNENQVVYEKEWERARTQLARALELDSGDQGVRGRLRLVEGHLARIKGSARRDGVLLTQAVEKFHQAQQQMPKSPDPQLGLARVYVYGLKDIDKAYGALHEAERRGYRLGNREKMQLADGYRERGDRLWWDSRNVRGLPQEKDQISRAADDYRRALELYQGIVPYGNANSAIVRVQQSVESVVIRLRQIEEGAR